MRTLHLTEEEFKILCESVRVGLYFHQADWAEGDPNESGENLAWVRQYHQRGARLQRATRLLMRAEKNTKKKV